MQLIFQCPQCQKRTAQQAEPKSVPVSCDHCNWQRDQGAADFDGDYLRRCRVCGCDDLWRQKDFPPALGLGMVAVAATLSTIAWANYSPVWAIGILMVAGLIDSVLYLWMTDMLVCYRCRSRHRRTALDEGHVPFDLEKNERYVQMERRQREAEKRDSLNVSAASASNPQPKETADE